MEAIAWQKHVTITVPARPAGVWTWALDVVDGPAWLQIEASPKGVWSYSASNSCGPDGDLGSMIRREATLLATAPVGALILKLGGSTADVGTGTLMAVGSKALIPVTAKQSGALFLTINDEPTGFVDNDGALEVKISIGKRQEAPDTD